MNFTSQLLENYSLYKERLLVYRHFQPEEFNEILEDIIKKQNSNFELKKLGQSAQKRPIYHLTFGNGKTPVLLWSQMHGNEPTATMALLDIFHFLENPITEEDKKLVEILKTYFTLHFVPVLNPDGTALFTRRTAQGIDMNRDFLQRQTPEANLLIDLAAELKPHFSFNLHDQRSKYSVGKNPVPTTLAFLAPAFDKETTIKKEGMRRLEAMQVISLMAEGLEEELGGKMAKYDDAFEVRAFGDNFQKLGYGTILIESGHYPNDWEKQEVRKYNYASILNGLLSIANDLHKDKSIKSYEDLPFNGTQFHDVILRNVEIEFPQFVKFRADIAFERHSKFDTKENQYLFASTIVDIGDLSTFYGHEEHNFEDYKIVMQSEKIELESNPNLVFENIENPKKRFVVLNGVVSGLI
ncbi:putative carboxypeptidase [Bernardetia litoralis DSM 6794]|uniref:Putative carboxypeptidase n=1 Tax=Bernardetia litoralis (strain ATCC 23117 / DSM 6794 / NBRC 15988 / NCIMB 1366 / Fx l1 / Sio-4) TaxID=880071 RepID=I4AKE3_BERLS|nr:M14 family zinc carboxypeptidase [Bernardetia litoralis]AFM04428.1 putative carboxypeptidase [Bernardetia litoralis DSM 6794]